jgi:hypothetical protein
VITRSLPGRARCVVLGIVVTSCPSQPSPPPTRSRTAAPTPIATAPSPAVTAGPPTTAPTALPASALWTRAGDLAEPRYHHIAVALQDGRVLVAGGIKLVPEGDADVAAVALDSVEIFDPATGAWATAPPMHEARADPVATLLADGRVLVIGGHGTLAGSDLAVSIRSAELFNPRTNRWTVVPDVPSRVFWESATLLDDGRILAIANTGHASSFEEAASLYDPSTGSWTPTSKTDLVRSGHVAIKLGDGRVVAAGGTKPSAELPDPQPDAAVYDPDRDSWLDHGPMPVPGFDMRAARLPDGRVLLGLGSQALLFSGNYGWSYTTTGLVGEITELATLADGRIVAINVADRPGSIVQIYDTTILSWSTAGGFPDVTDFTMTALGEGRVLVAGGYVGCADVNPCATGETANTWLFDPAKAR